MPRGQCGPNDKHDETPERRRIRLGEPDANAPTKGPDRRHPAREREGARQRRLPAPNGAGDGGARRMPGDG